jgi:hypothetical protein
MIVLVGIGIILAAVQETVYIMHNRHVQQGQGKLSMGKRSSDHMCLELIDTTDRSADKNATQFHRQGGEEKSTVAGSSESRYECQSVLVANIKSGKNMSREIP